MFPENTGHENETFTCDATRQTLKRLPLSTCDLQLLVGKGPFWVNILLIAGWLHVVSFAYYSQPITLWSIERSLLVAHHHGDLEFIACCKSRVLQHWLPIETVKSTEAACK
jgi:hypothetical protein